MLPIMTRVVGEPRVVTVARDVWAGSRSPEGFYAAFAESTVYAQRPERPGLMIADLAARGRWTVVFSSLERLAAYAGECEYLSTSGADLLELVPEGVGVLLDPADEHRFPVLTRVTSPEMVAAEWNRVAARRGWLRAAGSGRSGAEAIGKETPG